MATAYCLFVRLATLPAVGLLDERYFLYYEDAEWTVRASRRAWLNAVVLDASARHKVSRSAGSFLEPWRASTSRGTATFSSVPTVC